MGHTFSKAQFALGSERSISREDATRITPMWQDRIITVAWWLWVVLLAAAILRAVIAAPPT
jgi:hypothetical protein